MDEKVFKETLNKMLKLQSLYNELYSEEPGHILGVDYEKIHVSNEFFAKVSVGEVVSRETWEEYIRKECTHVDHIFITLVELDNKKGDK